MAGIWSRYMELSHKHKVSTQLSRYPADLPSPPTTLESVELMRYIAEGVLSFGDSFCAIEETGTFRPQL